MYRIPTGTVVSIARDDQNRFWKRFVTTKPLQFSRYRTFLSGAYTFERNGWLLLIRADRIESSQSRFGYLLPEPHLTL